MSGDKWARVGGGVKGRRGVKNRDFHGEILFERPLFNIVGLGSLCKIMGVALGMWCGCGSEGTNKQRLGNLRNVRSKCMRELLC